MTIVVHITQHPGCHVCHFLRLVCHLERSSSCIVHCQYMHRASQQRIVHRALSSCIVHCHRASCIVSACIVHRSSASCIVYACGRSAAAIGVIWSAHRCRESHRQSGYVQSVIIRLSILYTIDSRTPTQLTVAHIHTLYDIVDRCPISHAFIIYGVYRT